MQHRIWSAVVALLAIGGAVVGLDAQPRPTLERADVGVTYESPSACRVEVTPTFRDATVVRHQLVLTDGVVIEDVTVRGDAALLEVPRRVSRGAGLTVTVNITRGTPVGASMAPGSRASASASASAQAGASREATDQANAMATYVLSYRATGLPRFQCPVAVPEIPSTGVPGRVALHVAIPNGEATPTSAFPGMAWQGGEGRASLGHVPAFVLAPFGAAAAGMTLTRVMDTLAFVILIGGSAIWFWNKKRRP